MILPYVYCLMDPWKPRLPAVSEMQQAGHSTGCWWWLCDATIVPPISGLPLASLQAVRGNVEEVLIEKDQRGQRQQLMKDLDLEQVGAAAATAAAALLGAAVSLGTGWNA